MPPFFLLLFLTLLSAQNAFPPLPLTPCETALISLFQGTRENAGLIINAMGKSANNLGNFDECLALNDTRYCLLSIDVQQPFPVLAGWCVPEVCDGPALEEALDTFFRKNISDLFFGKSVSVRISVLFGGIEQSLGPYPLNTPQGVPNISAVCANYNESKFTTGALVLLIVIFLFVLLTLTGTLVDYYLKEEVEGEEDKKILHKPIKYDHEPSESDTNNDSIGLQDLSQVSDGENTDHEESEVSPISFASLNREMFGVKLLLVFSLLHNLKSFTAKERSTDTQFLNGIRVLSIFYVMLGHTNSFMIVAPVLDLYHVIMQVFKTLPFQIITGGFFAVDTFFFLSGMLVCMALMDLLKKEKVNWFLVYFHRWWRLTPLYFFVIWIYSYLTPFLSDGPLGNTQRSMFALVTDNCKQYWWANVLYINNFIPWDNSSGDGCLLWGWYLADDMQLFVITPAFLILYLKNKKIGIMVILSFLAASFIGVGTYIGISKNFTMGDSDFFNHYYIKPWSRLGPYFIGAALAVLWKEKGKVKISVPFRFLAYLSAAILLITTVFGTYTNENSSWTVTENVFYYTFSRTGFILGLAIICYLMLNKQADFIRVILSYDFWTPLARLSYGAYLVHPIIIISFYTSTRVALSWDIWSVSVNYCGFIVLTYGVSFVLWLLVEKPMANLETVIITRIKGSQVV